MSGRFGNDLTGKTFAAWGLAFKPDTDDMRESPAITILSALTEAGARIKAYDPKAVREARECYLKGNENITYCDNQYDEQPEWIYGTGKSGESGRVHNVGAGGEGNYK